MDLASFTVNPQKRRTSYTSDSASIYQNTMTFMVRSTNHTRFTNRQKILGEALLPKGKPITTYVVVSKAKPSNSR
jgi:hypothetical protein